jgi:O-antigen ligase
MKALSTALYCFMLSRYGIRGIFSIQTPWRVIVLILVVAVGMLGGFRAMVIIFAMVFAMQFFLEGLHKTRLVLPMACFGLLGAVVLVAVAPKLPVTYQRALSFLPLQGLDARATLDAEGSAEWRFRIWKSVLPRIPEHLLLGTGYSLSRKDYGFLFSTSEGSTLEQDWDSTVVGDYHNGPLSVILTFGIWGTIAFVWFLVAAIRVLVANYRYGAPELQIINTFLLAAFAAKTILFLVVFGGLHGDMLHFAGYVGLSVSLNGGVCRPVPPAVPGREATAGVPSLFGRPRPVFQRQFR